MCQHDSTGLGLNVILMKGKPGPFLLNFLNFFSYRKNSLISTVDVMIIILNKQLY